MLLLRQKKNERLFREAAKLESHHLAKVLLLEQRWNSTAKVALSSQYGVEMKNIPKKISIKSLISTRNFLAEIIQDAESDYEKAGAIQAFEVCYELARNTMRKVLNLRAVRVDDTPRAIFRLAGVEGLISDVDIWMEFTKKRNQTSHAYDGEKANDILISLPAFLRELNLLIENLEEIPECCN